MVAGSAVPVEACREIDASPSAVARTGMERAGEAAPTTVNCASGGGDAAAAAPSPPSTPEFVTVVSRKSKKQKEKKLLREPLIPPPPPALPQSSSAAQVVLCPSPKRPSALEAIAWTESIAAALVNSTNNTRAAAAGPATPPTSQQDNDGDDNDNAMAPPPPRVVLGGRGSSVQSAGSGRSSSARSASSPPSREATLSPQTMLPLRVLVWGERASSSSAAMAPFPSYSSLGRSPSSSDLPASPEKKCQQTAAIGLQASPHKRSAPDLVAGWSAPNLVGLFSSVCSQCRDRAEKLLANAGNNENPEVELLAFFASPTQNEKLLLGREIRKLLGAVRSHVVVPAARFPQDVEDCLVGPSHSSTSHSASIAGGSLLTAHSKHGRAAGNGGKGKRVRRLAYSPRIVQFSGHAISANHSSTAEEEEEAGGESAGPLVFEQDLTNDKDHRHPQAATNTTASSSSSSSTAQSSRQRPLPKPLSGPSEASFVEVLSRCPRLEGVFLNACGTSGYARHIARCLPEVGVVCWRGEVAGQLAFKFAEFFFVQLGRWHGRSFTDSFRDALGAYRRFWRSEGQYELFKIAVDRRSRRRRRRVGLVAAAAAAAEAAVARNEEEKEEAAILARATMRQHTAQKQQQQSRVSLWGGWRPPNAGSSTRHGLATNGLATNGLAAIATRVGATGATTGAAAAATVPESQARVVLPGDARPAGAAAEPPMSTTASAPAATVTRTDKASSSFSSVDKATDAAVEAAPSSLVAAAEDVSAGLLPKGEYIKQFNRFLRGGGGLGRLTTSSGGCGAAGGRRSSESALLPFVEPILVRSGSNEEGGGEASALGVRSTPLPFEHERKKSGAPRKPVPPSPFSAAPPTREKTTGSADGNWRGSPPLPPASSSARHRQQQPPQWSASPQPCPLQVAGPAVTATTVQNRLVAPFMSSPASENVGSIASSGGSGNNNPWGRLSVPAPVTPAEFGPPLPQVAAAPPLLQSSSTSPPPPPPPPPPLLQTSSTYMPVSPLLLSTSSSATLTTATPVLSTLVLASFPAPSPLTGDKATPTAPEIAGTVETTRAGLAIPRAEAPVSEQQPPRRSPPSGISRALQRQRSEDKSKGPDADGKQ